MSAMMRSVTSAYVVSRAAEPAVRREAAAAGPEAHSAQSGRRPVARRSAVRAAASHVPAECRAGTNRAHPECSASRATPRSPRSSRPRHG